MLKMSQTILLIAMTELQSDKHWADNPVKVLPTRPMSTRLLQSLRGGRLVTILQLQSKTVYCDIVDDDDDDGNHDEDVGDHLVASCHELLDPRLGWLHDILQ